MSNNHGVHGFSGSTDHNDINHRNHAPLAGNDQSGADAHTHAGEESAAVSAMRATLPEGSLDTTLNTHIRPPRRPHRIGMRAAAAIIAMILLMMLFGVVNGSAGDSGAARNGQSVTIGLKLAPTNLNIRNQSGSALEQLLIGNVYEGLVTRDENNHVITSLAQSWDSSADGKTYTFHLHHGMRFSNGDVLNAEDAVWSIKELIRRQYQGSEHLKHVTSVSAPDTDTVRITLDEPYADLLWALSGRAGLVLDRHAQYDHATQAIGSGPYMITKYVPNSSVVLQANPRYWGAHKARTARIIIRYFTDDSAAVNALKSGDVQVLAPLTQNLAGPFIKDTRHYEVKVGDGTDKFVLAFNMKGPRTADKRVRQAIRYAIDHRQLIASRGGADAALGGPIPSLDPGYEDLTSVYPHDVARAKGLMHEAGYDADHPLSLTLTYANIYGVELGDQLRSQLKPIGIDLHIKVVEFSTWLQDVYKNHDYDLSLVDHNDSHDFDLWSDPTYYYGYDNPTVRRLTEEASRATSSERNARLLARAARIVSQDAPADWLFNYRITTVYATGVQGFPINLNQIFMPLYDVTYTPSEGR